MPARKKSFREFVADGTFLARRHAHLLDQEPLVADTELAKLQRAYQREGSELERRAIALRFEKAVRKRAFDRRGRADVELDRALRELGPPGSAQQMINFFPRFLRWDDGSPFVLEGWQQQIIREIYRRDRRRRRLYKTITLGVTRGSGKTPLASGIGTCSVLTLPGRPRVFQASGAKEQAALGLEYVVNWIEDDDDLASWLRPRSLGVSRRDGRGHYTVMAASGGLGHGRRPNVGLFDEWWTATTKAQTQTYTALETAMHKIADAFLLAFSTAGWDKSSQLGREYDSALELPDVRTYHEGFLTVARDVDAGRLFWWYGLPDGYDLDLEDERAVRRALKLANPASWIDLDELVRALRRMMQRGEELEWIRLYLNGWTQARGLWLPSGRWRALADDELEIPEGAEVYVAVDAAHTYDTVAVAWAWVAPDGRIVVRAKVWSVRDDAPAHEYVEDFYDEENDLRHVAELYVHWLGERYRIREIVFDPNYFGTEGRRLGRRFRTAPLFPQSNDMRRYVQEFYRDVASGRIAHDGDEVVAQHVGAIEGQKTSDGYWQIKKLNNARPIDAGVAEIMASGRARRVLDRTRPTVSAL